MDPTSRPLQIAIIGGGVAGLVLAGTLAKYGADTRKLDVAVYEAAASFEGEFGAGITVAARSFEIIQALGLEEDLAKIEQGKADSDYAFLYRRSDQGAKGHDLVLRRLGKGAAYHRAELRAVFARNLARFDSVHVHFNKRLESLSFTLRSPETGQYELRFKDGTTATCDVLIGAEGIRSPVRAAMFDIAASAATQSDPASDLRAYGPPIWSGECVYRSLVPMARLAAEWERLGGEGPHRIMKERLIYCGKRKKLVTYAIQNKTLANVGAFVTVADAEGTPFESENWVQDVDPTFITSEFEGWETEARAVVNCITKASRWAIHVVKKLPFFAYGRIAVIGDAAHAMTPHNGSGANQALEDAFLLGRLLAHPSTTAKTLNLALQAYDAIRRPRAQAVADLSVELGRLGDFTAELQLAEGEDEDVAIAARMRNCGDWVLQGCMDDDVQRAVTMLESLVERHG